MKPFAFLLAFFISLVPTTFADNKPSPSIIRAIELNQGTWSYLGASVQANFSSGANSPAASCHGKLLYARTDEKILFTCANAEGQLLFIFKTEDDLFELFIPAANTIYHGSIFDLEDSAEMHSHLKPLSFYRALKLMAILAEDSSIEQGNQITTINQFKGENPSRYLYRQLTIDDQYRVISEEYFRPNSKSWTRIQRENFQQFKVSKKIRFVFPNKVSFESYSPSVSSKLGKDILENDLSVSRTTLDFSTLQFPNTIPDDQWIAPYPESAKRIEIISELA